MKPNKENLIEVIKNGDDSHNNVLVLNLDASFELINGDGIDDVKNVKGNNYIVRYETFNAGKDYVGKSASNDNKFIDRIYNKSLEYWNKYTETKIPCHIYCDVF